MGDELTAKIGFVVDPDAPVHRQIAYVLTAYDLAADAWDIWTPAGGEPKAQRSAQEYAEALFLVTSHALQGTKIEKGTKEPAGTRRKTTEGMVIAETDPRVGYWVKRVFNVINGRGQYDAVSARLRKDLSPVLRTVGSRARTRNRRPIPANRRVVIAGDYARRISYWNIRQEPFASIDFPGYIERKERVRLSTTPSNSFVFAQIMEIAEQIRGGGTPTTWQGLYRQAARDINYAPSPGWLEMGAHRVNGPATEELNPSPRRSEPLFVGPERRLTGPVMKFPETVRQYRKVLLTGPHGSGKTTAFRLLANSWTTGKLGAGELDLCFYIRLRSAEPLLEEYLKKERKADIALLVGRSVASTLSYRCTIEQLAHCTTARGAHPGPNGQVGVAQPTVEEILDWIQQEAARWFREEGCLNDNVVVLIDGMNELRLDLRAPVGRSIAELSGKPCRVAVACRSNVADEFFSNVHGQFTRFELQELDEEKIASYIDYRIPGRGKEIFSLRLRSDPRMLSIARNPFYLSLITQAMQREPDANIPSNRALLIGDFVRRSMLRKQEEHVFASDTINDNLLSAVLPVAAKWSLDLITGTAERTSFHQSPHFRSIPASSAEVFAALRLAEEYGLLASSGLPTAFHGSRERPEFVHDNVRDYFAALYLKGLPGADFTQSLPDRVEYFVWDEPLLLFLELGVPGQRLRDVAERVMAADPVVASMCVRCADGASNDLVLALERKIRDSADYQARTTYLPDDFTSYYSRPVGRCLPAHILGRLPVSLLLDLALHSDEDQSMNQFAWLAVRENVDQNHLDQLRELWNSLPREDCINRLGVFVATCAIPTKPALRQVADMWREIRALPQSDILAVLPGLSILRHIRYPVSPSEALALFPIAEYEQQLRAVVSSFAAAAEEEEEEEAHPEGAAAICATASANECAEVLATLLGRDAIPILRECAYVLSSSSIAYDGYAYTCLRPTLLEMIGDLDRQQAVEILVENMKIEANCHADVRTWQLLLGTYGTEVVTHAIDCICQHAGTDASFLCADYLQSYPTKPDVLACFRQYVDTHSPATEATRLLGAILGLSEFLPHAQHILEAFWASTTLHQKRLSPENDLHDGVSDRQSNGTYENTREGDHRLLALALRTVHNFPPYCDTVRLWTLLGQSCAHLRKNTSKFAVNVELELVVRCIRCIADVVKGRTRVSLVSILSSGTFHDLSNLMIRRWPQGLDYWHDRLATATQDLFASMMPECTEYLISLFRTLYDVFTTHPSAEWMHMSRTADVLLHICRHADDAQAVSLMRYVRDLSRRTNSTEAQRDDCLKLIDSIRRVKGRRFLGAIGIEPES